MSPISNISSSLYNVSEQISTSVRNITQKSQVEIKGFEPAQLDNKQNLVSFSLNNYAFSYLEPSSLYSLQKMVSQAPEQEGLEKQKEKQQQQQILGDDDKEKSGNVENAQNVDGAGFVEELNGFLPVSEVAYSAKPYIAPEMQISPVFGSRISVEDNLSYAIDSYNQAFNSTKTSSVLIDFMHKNNRSFDFRI